MCVLVSLCFNFNQSGAETDCFQTEKETLARIACVGLGLVTVSANIYPRFHLAFHIKGKEGKLRGL